MPFLTVFSLHYGFLIVLASLLVLFSIPLFFEIKNKFLLNNYSMLFSKKKIVSHIYIYLIK